VPPSVLAKATKCSAMARALASGNNARVWLEERADVVIALIVKELNHRTMQNKHSNRKG
jgi:hypothetical protein